MRRFYRRFRIRSLPVRLVLTPGSSKLPGKTKPKETTVLPPEHRPDDGRGYPTSPRRALVFVLLGPVFGVLAPWSIAAVMSGGHVELEGIPPAYLISLIVCAITASVDGVLARVTPIRLRAPLTAAVGAAVTGSICLLLGVLLVGSKVLILWPLLILVSIVGAVATGMSSLLSHNYRAARF